MGLVEVRPGVIRQRCSRRATSSRTRSQRDPWGVAGRRRVDALRSRGDVSLALMGPSVRGRTEIRAVDESGPLELLRVDPTEPAGGLGSRC